MEMTCTAIVFCNTGEKGGSAIFYPTKELKSRQFRVFTLKPSKTTIVNKARINLSSIKEYKKSKRKCLIAMKE